MEARIITLPPIQVVGCRIEATVEEFESGLGKDAYRSLVERKDEIAGKKHEHPILMQIYPDRPDFDPQTDSFSHLLGYEVVHPGGAPAPAQMISHSVPEGKYVTFTHKGLESELSHSYAYVYGEWMCETGHEPKDYDFEIWDERYEPDSPDNEIDLFIALK
ncbi:GyrI-like domain-containing protein [Paenibacillus filicis]|uniref:GyrI-like domain-containing protein n=1 Tax=Paenibacillus filicis TaxID=669464 RepID=A0ABU9DC99_9BACL